MNTTQKPDALRLADWLDDQTVPDHYKGFAATELRRLYARVTELEQRLEIDPRHRYDGISARDVTIKAQDDRIAELEEMLRREVQHSAGLSVPESDVPVTLPEPDAYLYVNGNHRGVSLEWRSDMDLSVGTERHALYTEKQVRAIAAAAKQGAKK
jgi:hypothetical protein